MGTVLFPCGCAISTSMFGDHQVMGVIHCFEHMSLYSQDKTMRQMAAEIRAAVPDLTEDVGDFPADSAEWDQTPAGQALLEAGNEMARVLDQEILPRYQELFEAAGLGAVSLSVAVQDATRVLEGWRRVAGLGEQGR